MKKLLLLLLGCFSICNSLNAQGISILNSGPDVICGPDYITLQLTVTPYNPAHGFIWIKQNYDNFAQSQIIDFDTMGYGQSVFYIPALQNHGTTTIFCYETVNGIVINSAAKSIYYVPDVIPFYFDATGCQEIYIPGPFVFNYNLGFYAHLFKDGIDQNMSPNIGSPPSGNYQVTLNIGGCTMSTPIIPVVSTIPVASIVPGGPLILCAGDSVNLSAPTGVLYQWSDWQTTSNIYAKTSGTYAVTVTYNNGCTASSAPVNVSVMPLVTVTVSDTAACIGDTITLTSQAAAGYSWELNGVAINGATSQTLKAYQTGSYKVATTGLGCNKSNAMSLGFHVFPSVSVSAGGSLSLHAGTGVLLSASATNATLFQWYKNGVAVPGITNPTFFANLAGTYKCEVSNGCKIKSSPKTVAVISGNQLPSQTTTIQPDGVAGKDCYFPNFGGNYGNMDRMYVQYSGNKYRSLLQFDLSIIPPSTIINSAKLSLYEYTSTSNINSNASYLDPLLSSWNETAVTWITQPGITTYNRTSIPATTTDLLNLNVKGAVICMVNEPAKNYGWRHWLQLEAAPNGNLTFASSDNLTPSIRPKLVINYAYAKIVASGSLNICNGNPVTLSTNSGPYTYQWKKNGINLPGEISISTIVTTAGNYSVVITDPTGCKVESVQKQVNASSTPAATITALGPTTFCLGDSVTFQANTGAGLSYQWKNNSVIIPGAVTAIYTAKTAGSYKVIVTNAGGCSKTSPTKTVSVPCRENNPFSKAAELEVFPNPSDHDFFIKMPGLEDTELYCNIYDIRGIKIKAFLFNSNEGLKFGEDLNPGCYLIEILSDNYFRKEVVIKQ